MLPRLSSLLAVTAMLSMIHPVSGQAKATWKSFEARAYKEKAMLVVEGVECRYFLADSETPVEAVVTGPARIKVLTRLDLKGLSEDEAFYTLSVWLDGEKVDSIEKSTHASEVAVVMPGETEVGVIRRFYLDVPQGTHVCEVGPANRGDRVYMRFFRPIEEKKRKLVSLSPSSEAEPLTALYKEKEISYYMLDKSEPVTLELNGPTELKVTSRLHFDESMMGRQNYIVELVIDDSEHRSFQIETTRSSSVTFKEMPGVIPGVAKSFVLPVKKGRHHLAFRLTATAAESAGIRLRIPESDLSIEP
jgi:hypothetical protein